MKEGPLLRVLIAMQMGHNDTSESGVLIHLNPGQAGMLSQKENVYFWTGQGYHRKVASKIFV